METVHLIKVILFILIVFQFLRNWITVENKDTWKANVTGQVKSWLDNGLKPRAVTRDLDWGIPVKVDGDAVSYTHLTLPTILLV